MKIFLVLFMLLPLVLSAQETQSTEEEEPMVAEEESYQAEVPPGEFVYQPQGRRDPFWDLTKGEKAKTEREELEGIAGLLIEELKLEGITFAKGQYQALMSGPSNAEPPFVVAVGVNVYDGVIVKIDANSVVFKKILTMPLGGKKEKFETKWLIPEKEAKRR